MLNVKLKKKVYITKTLEFFCTDWPALADKVTVDGIRYRRLSADVWQWMHTGTNFYNHMLDEDMQDNEIDKILDNHKMLYKLITTLTRQRELPEAFKLQGN